MLLKCVMCSLFAFVYFLERNLCYIWKHLKFILLHSLSSRAIQCQIKHFEWYISYSSHVFHYQKRKDYLEGCIGLKTLFLITRILSEPGVLPGN